MMDKNQKTHPNKKSKGGQSKKQSGADESHETGRSGVSKGRQSEQKR
jgi:hypothetical protein